VPPAISATFSRASGSADGSRDGRLLAATNANDILVRALNDGVYAARSKPTLSRRWTSSREHFERALFEASNRDSVWLAAAMDDFARKRKLVIPSRCLTYCGCATTPSDLRRGDLARCGTSTAGQGASSTRTRRRVRLPPPDAPDSAPVVCSLRRYANSPRRSLGPPGGPLPLAFDIYVERTAYFLANDAQSLRNFIETRTGP